VTEDFPENPATLLAHDPEFAEHAVVPPIYQTSLFTFASHAEMRAAFAGEAAHPFYSRVGNPTVALFEEKIAKLEGAEAAKGFASGMGAISAAVLSCCGAGDRLVVVRNIYPDAYRMFGMLLPRLGVTVEYVDGTDLGAVARALPGATALYLESPASWVFDCLDIPALAKLARAAGATTILDNSWATPIFQRPCRHGIDLVLHSASKYISGHSDTVAGVIAGRSTLIERIGREIHPFLGAKLAPFEAWLLIRGLRTLPLRMARHHATALALAERLAAHDSVRRVLHPGRGTPGTTLAGWSGLFAFEAEESLSIPAFCDALRLFKLGVSWGGHESLALPAAMALLQTQGPNSVRDFAVPERLIRLSIGLEDMEDLWRDLDQALSRTA
jgi:cystathionine beta-lyase/cystathionine gamma-synthase